MTAPRKTFFPRSLDNPAPKPSRQSQASDVLWGRPIFKAPQLPNPRVMFDPLPFTAARVTYHAPVALSA